MLNHTAHDALPARIQRRLPAVLPNYLGAQRWFGGKAHIIRSVAVPEVVPVYIEDSSVYLVLVSVEYSSAPTQLYVLPLVAVSRPEAVAASGEAARAGMVLEQEDQQPTCILRDALYERSFSLWLIESIRRRDQLPGINGKVLAKPGTALAPLWSREQGTLEPSVMKGEQSNTSVRYGNTFILKFYRRIQEGVNPDLEVGSFLTEKAYFKYTPPLAGALQYEQSSRPSTTLAVLQGYVHNLGDAWRYTLNALDAFLASVARQPSAAPSDEPAHPGHLRQWASQSPSARAQELLGPYLRRVQLLGRRTGELHLALASGSGDPAFTAEPFSAEDRRSLADTMADLADNTLHLLQERLALLPPASRQKAHRVISARPGLFSQLGEVSRLQTLGMRTRIHGDYHLGQVLVTEDDFAIIDFEGEPERPLSERRLKHSPLRDVAGMLRSFQYAASSVRIERGVKSDSHAQDAQRALYWLRLWTEWVSAAFLQAYLHQAAEGRILPEGKQDLFSLLEAFLLEKTIYELAYELKNRPDWVEIPLDGLLELFLENR